MKFITVSIILILFGQLNAQNLCGKFEDYKESQKWVKEINDLSPDIRKNKIFKRIKCEQASEKGDIDFWLTIVIGGGIVSNAKDLSNEQIETLQLIPSENIAHGQSLCESDGIYPEQCNLGFVLISGPDKPVLNEIAELKNIRLKRSKNKIIIKFESDIQSEIDFEINHLLKDHSSTLLTSTELKKGKNKFVFRRSGNLQIVEAKTKGKKLIIII